MGDKREKKQLKKKRKEQAKKNKVVYDSQIGDEVLLKFNSLNHLLMKYDFQAQEEVHELLPDVEPEEGPRETAKDPVDEQEELHDEQEETNIQDNSYESKYDDVPDEENDPDADMKKILKEMRETGEDLSMQSQEELWEQKSQVLGEEDDNASKSYEEKTEGDLNENNVWEEKTQAEDSSPPREREENAIPQAELVERIGHNEEETESLRGLEGEEITGDKIEIDQTGKEQTEVGKVVKDGEHDEVDEEAKQCEQEEVNEEPIEVRPRSAVESPKSQLSPASSRASRSAPASPLSASSEFPEHYDDNEMLKKTVNFVPEEIGAGEEAGSNTVSETDSKVLNENLPSEAKVEETTELPTEADKVATRPLS